MKLLGFPPCWMLETSSFSLLCVTWGNLSALKSVLAEQCCSGICSFILVSDHRCVSRVCYSPSISISCVAAFNLDNEQPDYDMDSEDETLLNRLNRKMEIKPLQFEIMVDRLEKASSSQVWWEGISGRFCFPGGWF